MDPRRIIENASIIVEPLFFGVPMPWDPPPQTAGTAAPAAPGTPAAPAKVGT